MKLDFLSWAALLAAIVVTASAEYELARACGFHPVVAAGVPAALDIYAIRALRARRDVLAVVAAMIGVNAASHLVSSGLLPVDAPLVVAVSAIAPLVLWRVHRLAHQATTAEVVTETDTTEAVAVTEAVPAGARMLPIVAREDTTEVTITRANTDQVSGDVNADIAEHPEPAAVVTTPVSALEFRPITWPPEEPSKVTSAVPADTPRQVVTEVITLTPSELRRKARALNRELVTSTNRPVTIDRLREEFNLSRREAAELRRQVVTTKGDERS